ncbi:uncharacterized protein JCM6883_004873 [Sporobolomyces salmoneus]|uniref:uncharacterized protein n=1 Tax=Sporobolomyces salmoneus TaxID=183962 RepID=UPI00318221B5
MEPSALEDGNTHSDRPSCQQPGDSPAPEQHSIETLDLSDLITSDPASRRRHFLHALRNWSFEVEEVVQVPERVPAKAPVLEKADYVLDTSAMLKSEALRQFVEAEEREMAEEAAAKRGQNKAAARSVSSSSSSTSTAAPISTEPSSTTTGGTSAALSSILSLAISPPPTSEPLISSHVQQSRKPSSSTGSGKAVLGSSRVVNGTRENGKTREELVREKKKSLMSAAQRGGNSQEKRL